MGAQLSGYAGEVSRLIDLGILGDQADADVLLGMLARCGSEAEVDAVWRTARRWEYAPRPVPEWTDWRLELETTRN